MRAQVVGDGADGDAGGVAQRIAIGAGADRREGNAAQAVFGGDLEAASIRAGQELGLAPAAVAIHRADGMNHMPRRQLPAAGNLRVAGRAPAEATTLCEDRRAAGAMNCAIDAAAAE